MSEFPYIYESNPKMVDLKNSEVFWKSLVLRRFDVLDIAFINQRYRDFGRI